MIICHKYKFIFIRTRKTAGTSIELFLSKICSSNDILTPITTVKFDGYTPYNYKSYFNPLSETIKFSKLITPIKSNYPYQLWSSNPLKDFCKKRKFYNHIPAYQVKERISPQIWNSYYKFCFERNPWDKVISQYNFFNHFGQERSFENYFETKELPWNYPLYTNPLNSDEILVDRIAKYENLNEELSQIFEHLGIPFDGSLGTKAYTGLRKEKKSYQELFTGQYAKYRDLIGELFTPEIKLHGYTFN